MSTSNDGGPAFPVPVSFKPIPGTVGAGPGMSLRDYFAGQALAGILANSSDIMLQCNKGEALDRGDDTTQETYSRQPYEYADAMLKAREGSK